MNGSGKIMLAKSYSMKRTNRRAPAEAGNIEGLLLALGVPRRLLQPQRRTNDKSFWRRPLNHLEILEAAREAWRRAIAQVHPDRGGSTTLAAKVNALWQRVELLFRKKGYALG